MPTLTLTYFDFDGGRAEPTRLALHIGGIAFTDDRFPGARFPEVSKTTPLGQVPVLTVDGVAVTQSDAITRYAGQVAGLYPKDPFQALLCDEILQGLEDANIKLGTTFGLKGDELRSARERFANEVLPRYLGWLAQQLASHGGDYFADGRLTIADLKAFCLLRWLCSGVLDHIPADCVARQAPTLAAYLERIAALPAIAGYYQMRAQAKAAPA